MSRKLLLLGGHGGFDLRKVPLEVRARIRGSIWTARAPLPFGPRPGQPDNILCFDYLEHYSDPDRKIAIADYKLRGYTHGPMGPLVDPGYHGQLPASDFRADPGPYLNAAEQAEKSGVRVVHFLRPDRGVAGLDWTVDDLDRELGPIFRSDRVQRLFSIVCLGWEPGPKYFYNNAWWIEMCQWMAEIFPSALRLIHMVSDCDAPVGGDDDVKGITNGQGWANIAQYIHGYLAQYGGYVSQSDPVPSQEFISEFQKALADLKHRFATGGPDGTWPISSAWGTGFPIRVYAGEYAAFGDYWQNFPEKYSWVLGDAAMEAGADGYFDGGTVNV